MSLEEYGEAMVDKFFGLYARGLRDDATPDHCTVSQNIAYNKRGEIKVRDGTILSIGTTTPVKRMFVAALNHNDTQSIVLTCDGAGNIYRSDTGTVLLNVPGMVDFAAINAFSFTLISPILSAPAASNPVYIWQGAFGNPAADPIPIRPAAGPGPGVGMSGVESGTAGNCDIGVHEFAVSFVTNTGYTTQPGPMTAPPDETTFQAVKVTSTGGFCITLNNIPIGGPQVTERQILATQADQLEFFYAGGQILQGGVLVPWDGVIHDNTTTSITISFFDTDLVISADELFDLLPIIPGGTFSLIGGMAFYHGRVFYWGGEFNLIRVTDAGSTETINNVSGFIQLPDQFDGNDVTNCCNIQDSLYFFKFVGIFSVLDNGGEPSSWQIITVDAGAGCSSCQSLGTINMATPAFPQNQVALVTDFGGLYLFTGAIVQPPLSHKINDIWIGLQNTTHLDGTTLAVDPYGKLIYIAIKGSVNFPGYPNLLVADYNDGLDPDNIKWAVWTFPFSIQSIGMGFFQDQTEVAYRFRIGSSTNIYQVHPGALTDLGQPIVQIWRSFYAAYRLGALNIFRFIRARMPFFDPVQITLYSQDDAFIANPPGFTPPYTAGRDLVREFNFMDEKMAVQLCCNATHGGFTLQRLGIFGKPRFNMRPQV